MALESHGRQISVFCMHAVFLLRCLLTFYDHHTWFCFFLLEIMSALWMLLGRKCQQQLACDAELSWNSDGILIWIL